MFLGATLPMKQYERLAEFVYLSWMAFTAAGFVAPASRAGRIYNFSFTFVILILVSAYTANMAAALAVVEKVSPMLTSIEEAITQGDIVCAWNGGANSGWDKVKKSYPSLRLLETSGTSESFEWLAEGKCGAVLDGVSSLELSLYGEGRQNIDCNLRVVGRRQSESVGSFVMKSLCLQQTMDALLGQMADVNFQDTAWDDALPFKDACSTRKSADALKKLTELKPLDLSSTAGLFLLHAVVTLCTILIHIQNRVPKKTKLRTVAKTMISLQKAVSGFRVKPISQDTGTDRRRKSDSGTIASIKRKPAKQRSLKRLLGRNKVGRMPTEVGREGTDGTAPTRGWDGPPLPRHSSEDEDGTASSIDERFHTPAMEAPSQIGNPNISSLVQEHVDTRMKAMEDRIFSHLAGLTAKIDALSTVLNTEK
jgi:hypothetical protein